MLVKVENNLAFCELLKNLENHIDCLISSRVFIFNS
jgi:hypothetical protein